MVAEKSTVDTGLNIKQILKQIPHRYPFLLVDKIIEIDQNTIVGQKNLTMNEAFFQGHFPDAPIMPGVLILESLAQTAAIGVHERMDQNKIAVLLNIGYAKFRKPARPGDVLILKCFVTHFTSKAAKVKAEAYVGQELITDTEMSFAFVNKEQI